MLTLTFDLESFFGISTSLCKKISTRHAANAVRAISYLSDSR